MAVDGDGGDSCSDSTQQLLLLLAVRTISSVITYTSSNDVDVGSSMSYSVTRFSWAPKNRISLISRRMRRASTRSENAFFIALMATFRPFVTSSADTTMPYAPLPMGLITRYLLLMLNLRGRQRERMDARRWSICERQGHFEVAAHAAVAQLTPCRSRPSSSEGMPSPTYLRTMLRQSGWATTVKRRVRNFGLRNFVRVPPVPALPVTPN